MVFFRANNFKYVHSLNLMLLPNFRFFSVKYMFCWIFLVFGSTIMQCTTKFAATSVNGNYFIWWLLISVDNVMSCDVNMIKYICYEFLIRSRIKLCLQAVGFYVMHTHSNVRWISKINTNAVYNAISSLKSSTYSPWHASFKFSVQVLFEAK